MIPMIPMTLFDDRRKTTAAAAAGVGLAARLGAGCVSFTGMIPATPTTAVISRLASARTRQTRVAPVRH